MSKRDKAFGLLGNKQVNKSDIVYMCEVGSTVHGIGVGDQDDLDITAVRVEPWVEFVMGPPKRQSMMFRTADKGARSGPGDVDINVYTVRRWASLLSKSNPSVLNTLFVPPSAVLHDSTHGLIKDMAAVVVSKEAAQRFLGYMKHQLERLEGVRGQQNVNRPELVEAYGFDTKYAAHIIRLGYQGVEFLKTGRIPIPLPEDFATEIRNLRTGGFEKSEAIKWAHSMFAELREAEIDSNLPPKPSRQGIEARVAKFYAEQYDGWV